MFSILKHVEELEMHPCVQPNHLHIIMMILLMMISDQKKKDNSISFYFFDRISDPAVFSSLRQIHPPAKHVVRNLCAISGWQFPEKSQNQTFQYA